jgi:predicted peptidase
MVDGVSSKGPWMAVLKLSALALAPLVWLSFARAAGVRERGFLDRIHRDPDGKEARYVLFVPHEYQPDQTTPLILFLHGMGESGADGRKQAKVGLGPAVRKREKTFPAIVIFPQSQQRSWRAEGADAQRALRILTEVCDQYNVDPKRIYLSGLSMGGFGTWSLATRYPDRWAAIVPICGGGDSGKAAKIKDIPCWCFHGAKDMVVPFHLSREMVAALKAAGGHPKYTEYPDLWHESWDQAYDTSELYDWLFAQHK